MDFTRFDVPDKFGEFMDEAIELDLIDAKDFAALMITHNMKWGKIVDEVINYAFARIHCDNTHNEIVPYAEEFWNL